MGERAEALMRIVVLVISGIIIGVWKIPVQIITIIHWIMVIFSGKRNKGIADFCEYWNTETYKFIRYLTFVSNKRPFPFSDVEKLTKFK